MRDAQARAGGGAALPPVAVESTSSLLSSCSSPLSSPARSACVEDSDSDDDAQTEELQSIAEVTTGTCRLRFFNCSENFAHVQSQEDSHQYKNLDRVPGIVIMCLGGRAVTQSGWCFRRGSTRLASKCSPSPRGTPWWCRIQPGVRAMEGEGARGMKLTSTRGQQMEMRD